MGISRTGRIEFYKMKSCLRLFFEISFAHGYNFTLLRVIPLHLTLRASITLIITEQVGFLL